MAAAASRRPWLGLFVLVAILWLGPSCSVTTKADLASTTDNMQVWEVSDSVGRVYGTYKDHAEADLTGRYCLVTGGRKARGSLHGNTAELSILHEGTPFYRVTFLHFVFESNGHNTTVTMWYYNDVWKQNAEGFKKLLPTKVVSGPSSSRH